MPGPLVSCLCVTKNELYQVQRAVNCFYGQSYVHKELIIVYEGNKTKASDWFTQLKDPKIRVVQVTTTPKLSLGELRNISLTHAKGEYFCQWDDDDWHHRDRLKIQLAQALKHRHPATFLMNWLIYDELRRKAYFSQFGLWEGSILCKRDVFPRIKYPAQSTSEDSQFLAQLFARSRVFPVVYPNLYIYVFHGKNTYGKKHFNAIFNKSQKLSRASSILIRDILDSKYSVKTASGLLQSNKLLDEINYFFGKKQNLKKQVSQKKSMGQDGGYVAIAS